MQYNTAPWRCTAVVPDWSTCTCTDTTSHLPSHSTWPQAHVWSAKSSVADVGATPLFFPPLGSARLPLTTTAESDLWPTAEYCGGSWSYVGGGVSWTCRSTLAGDGGSFTLLSTTSVTACCTACWSSSLILPLPAIVYLLQHTVNTYTQESWAIAKMTARCALCMGALKIIGRPWLRPRLLFPKFLMGFCSDWAYKCAYKIWIS